jgi:hypothetical protein
MNTLVDALKGLASTHNDKGIVAYHYTLVGHALVRSLKDLLGPFWRRAHHVAWTRLYAVMMSVMMPVVVDFSQGGVKPSTPRQGDDKRRKSGLNFKDRNGNIGNLKLYTPEDMEQHNTPEDAWIIVHGNVVDVTSFANRHPGSKEILLAVAGTHAHTQHR